MDKTLADCIAIASQDDGLTAQPAMGHTAATLTEAHFRAESEQRPITCGNITIWPIGAKPGE